MRDNASSEPAAPTTIWTPANIVTLIRILLVPVFFVACVSPWPTWFPDWNEAELLKPWLAALLFVVLACTDALDGYLARSRGEVTNFGKFMDPLADKILVAAALLALCELQILPSWVALIILTREFIVSGLRMLAASEGVVIAASWYGKAKTVFQIIAILLFIIKDSEPFISTPAIETPLYVVSWIVMIIARAAALIALALEKGAKLSTAESCTGGLIAGSLTAVPGSSSVVEGGVVSYSNEVKHHLLNVSASDLEHYGAVSEPVAIQMAQGSRSALSTTVAVAVTGVAGPGGGSPEKPVGTVWFGVDSPRGSRAEAMHFAGDRASVREQTVAHALMLFEDELAAL